MLASHLPIEVPAPLAVGEPTNSYPFRWYVSPWLGGENPRPDGSVDLRRLAVDLAAFVLALQRVDTTGAPAPQDGPRGGPLASADGSTRRRAEQLRGEVDVDALLTVWDAGLHAPPCDGPAVWVHRDLSDGNLLVSEGRLSGVIDWGGLIAGDPAVELMVAWNLFDAQSRAVYRDALGFVHEAMWLRGPCVGGIRSDPGAAVLPRYQPRHRGEVLASRRRGARGPLGCFLVEIVALDRPVASQAQP